MFFPAPTTQVKERCMIVMDARRMKNRIRIHLGCSPRMHSSSGKTQDVEVSVDSNKRCKAKPLIVSELKKT